jgi:hypothetical protein
MFALFEYLAAETRSTYGADADPNAASSGEGPLLLLYDLGANAASSGDGSLLLLVFDLGANAASSGEGARIDGGMATAAIVEYLGTTV